jgi:hypothetical protein
MARPNLLLKVYIAEKTAANSVVTAYRHPIPTPRDHNAQNQQPFFAACVLSSSVDEKPVNFATLLRAVRTM